MNIDIGVGVLNRVWNRYESVSYPFTSLVQVNTGQADGTPGLDLNVAEAWGLGYTGRGVTIAIMDDGGFRLHWFSIMPVLSYA